MNERGSENGNNERHQNAAAKEQKEVSACVIPPAVGLVLQLKPDIPACLVLTVADEAGGFQETKASHDALFREPRM